MSNQNIPLPGAILKFYTGLQPRFPLPEGVSMMQPYREREVAEVSGAFYKKFYCDPSPRCLLFGINPGRFGGGITGIPFTDPVRLERDCGIANPWPKRGELSSEFVYEVIAAYGGPELFYADFFITALCPLGFVREGKNMNYYDDRKLLAACEPFIVETVRRQLSLMKSPDHCFCMGEGTNYKYFLRLNERHEFFKEIIPLPHPRWVMQYRRKRREEFVNLYLEKLRR